jgi:hypothetical protein
MIKESDIYRQNADNCMQLAEAAQDEAAYKRFKRMEAAWLALAEEQDWLDGEQSPALIHMPGGRQRGNRTASLLLFTLHARQLPDLRRVDSPSRNSRPGLRIGRPRFELRDRDRRRLMDKAAVLQRTVHSIDHHRRLSGRAIYQDQ